MTGADHSRQGLLASWGLPLRQALALGNPRKGKELDVG
jgi:hypothetical protein